MPSVAKPITEKRSEILPRPSISAPSKADKEVQTEATATRKLQIPQRSRIGISLESLSNPIVEKEGDTEPEEDDVSESFELSLAINSWKNYAQKIGSSTQYKLHSQAMNAASLNKDAEGNLHAKVDSRALMGLIAEVQYDLMQFLKTDLKIKKLRLKVDVEVQEKELAPYTNEEIYAHLVKINPTLDKLKTKYNLEL